jgi:hypothetical protein
VPCEAAPREDFRGEGVECQRPASAAGAIGESRLARRYKREPMAAAGEGVLSGQVLAGAMAEQGRHRHGAQRACSGGSQPEPRLLGHVLRWEMGGARGRARAGRSGRDRSSNRWLNRRRIDARRHRKAGRSRFGRASSAPRGMKILSEGLSGSGPTVRQSGTGAFFGRTQTGRP